MIATTLSLLVLRAHAGDFPATSNAVITAEPFDLGNLELRDFAIAPDRSEVFVLLRSPAASGQVTIEIRVFDANASLLRQRQLGRVAETDEAELFFTDQGSLVWNDFKYFHFIAPDSLLRQTFPQCRASAYPLLSVHQAQAVAAANAWREAMRQQLNQRFGLKAEEVRVDNTKIPQEFWANYRQISANAELKSAEFLSTAYQKMLANFAASAPPKTGLVIENAHARSYYARIRAEGHDWYCEFGEAAQRYAVRWQRVAIVPGSKSTRAFAPLSLTGDRLQQAALHLLVLDRRKTSSYAQDLVAPMQFDTDIAVSAGANVYRFTLKSAGLKLARDHATVLVNGRWVFSHLGVLYSLSSP